MPSWFELSASVAASVVSDSPNQFAARSDGVHWKNGCAAPTNIVPAMTRYLERWRASRPASRRPCGGRRRRSNAAKKTAQTGVVFAENGERLRRRVGYAGAPSSPSSASAWPIVSPSGAADVEISLATQRRTQPAAMATAPPTIESRRPATLRTDGSMRQNTTFVERKHVTRSASWTWKFRRTSGAMGAAEKQIQSDNNARRLRYLRVPAFGRPRSRADDPPRLPPAEGAGARSIRAGAAASPRLMFERE